MKELLLKTVMNFLRVHKKSDRPILFAYSGGTDSSALLFLLSECRNFFSLDLRIVHCNHGWREESKKEAEEIREDIERRGFILYQKTFETGKALSNAEEFAREERYAFFQSIYTSSGAQALVLAHQREDLAETVLKRVLEGSGLCSSRGMDPVGQRGNMTLWRPLLFVSRSEIIDLNRRNKVSFYNDSTNRDLRFLRGRMRVGILPRLESEFGKNVQKNLALLSKELSFLREHSEKVLSPFKEEVIAGKLGFMVSESTYVRADRFERRELLRSLLRDRGCYIGRDGLQRIEEAADKRGKIREIEVPFGELFLENGNIFWLETKNRVPVWGQEKYPESGQGVLFDFFSGNVSYIVSENPEEMVPVFYPGLEPEEKEKARRFFSRNEIPSAIRRFFPLPAKKDGCILSFYFFNSNSNSKENGNVLTFALKNI